MRIDRNLYQIRAEVLLNYLFPEMANDWITQYKGTFYRNYNEDILSLNEDEGRVVLARDGFLRLLPEGLMTKEDDLKGEDAAQKFKALEWRRAYDVGVVGAEVSLSAKGILQLRYLRRNECAGERGCRAIAVCQSLAR